MMSMAALIGGTQGGGSGCHGNSGDGGLEIAKEALFTGVHHLLP